MNNKFYREAVGECVSQVYEIENVNDWDEAKKIAFNDMSEGDSIAECSSSAVEEHDTFKDYHYIDMDECENYATLKKGIWANKIPSGNEYWEENAYYFDDATEIYLDCDGNEFDDWEDDLIHHYKAIKESDRFTIGEYDKGYKAYIINDGICGYYFWDTEEKAQQAADAYNSYDKWEELGKHGYGNDRITFDEIDEIDEDIVELYRLFHAVDTE